MGVDGQPGSPAGLSGTSIAHFEVLGLLGTGGFGEVYRARDTRLGRIVALKVLPAAFALDAGRRERFRREAIAASALNHPNICTIHDLVEAGGRTVIVMELVEGRTLHAALAEGPLVSADALPIARQIAAALAEAHRAGVVHRDIKPGNIVLTSRGEVKVLDFGLAKLIGPEPEEATGSTLEKLTADGASAGTPGYMSPEQILGGPLDGRSDLFSFGVVLYRMVTGQLPFQGGSHAALVDSILHAEPRDFGARPIPEKLKAIIRKLLQKDPANRYASAAEFLADLKELEASDAPGRRTRLSRRARAGIAVAALLAVTGAGWLWHRSSRVRWALETATPEATRLVDAWEFQKAAALIREARAILPKDPALEKLWRRATGEISITSVPAGADVSLRPYEGDPGAWQSLGKTPLEEIRVPFDGYVYRIAKPGYATLHELDQTNIEYTVRLFPEESVPPEMVPVSGEETGVLSPGLRDAPKVLLADYLIDRHEVTNEEYRKFVNAGGYQRREFWKEPFVKDGRPLSWQEAVALFVDTTGRPGPSTWEAASFRQGLEKHPVAGVSWYEAAAFADFAGRRLPTVYHWTLAAQNYLAWLIVPGSNLRGTGTQPVGSPGTLSGFGTTDMAGNVKEWCWNQGRGGTRYIMGGGFGEPDYMFVDQDAQSPWDRAPNFGFRCVKFPSPPPPAAAANLEPLVRDFSRERPVSDEVFGAFRGLYVYDRGALNAKVEEKESAADWTREKVTFDAAYGGERVVAQLYLPKNAAPPFQTVVYFPGSGAIYADKLDTSELWGNNFILRSGRALIIPTFKGTYERRDGLKSDIPNATALWRDHMIAWSKDMGRSLDYLQTRNEIDSGRIAYVGNSWGTAIAPVLLAIESRFRAALLWSGGLELHRALPEVDPINFVTRVKLPVLMLNGRFDYMYPAESSQLPLFRLLGTPQGEKRRIAYDSGHIAPRAEKIRDSLDWLDRYLGPVDRKPGPN